MGISIHEMVAQMQGGMDDGYGPSELVYCIVEDDDKALTLGVFSVGEDGTQEEVREAANACKAKYEAAPFVSPFIKHGHILLADYGGAQKLANMALSLYNGHAFPFDAGSLGGLDAKHLEICIELIRSYHQFRENDKDFLDVCKQIKKLRGIS